MLTEKEVLQSQSNIGRQSGCTTQGNPTQQSTENNDENNHVFTKINLNTAKLKDLIINWDKYEIFKSYSERYIYTVYKAVDKNGKNYEIAISHDIYDGVLSSEYDKYTSEMYIEIYTRLI